ncbi:GyrI-like domain-containing protein [Chloroflexota bacterium]
MEKIDVRKEFKQLYNPSPKEAMIVNVPEMNFLMIDGAGNPNTAQEYKDAIEALYAMSYALKFMVKKGQTAVDYGVMPLEGLWWSDDMTQFSVENKDIWKWTSMIMQPKFITKNMFDEAVAQVAKKKNPSALTKMRFESFHEGIAAQIMHLGPYSAEGPTIERLHNFIEENGYELEGKHHEIYLTDPNRSTPEKMKIVIRQPAKR